jgi:hypothetical protein
MAHLHKPGPSALDACAISPAWRAAARGARAMFHVKQPAGHAPWAWGYADSA